MTARPPATFTLADVWEAVADAVPDREALVRTPRLTYRELEDRANRLAHHLVESGYDPATTVGLYLSNGTGTGGVPGVVQGRAVPVNVNYRYVADELRYLLDDAGAGAVLFGRALGPRWRRSSMICPMSRRSWGWRTARAPTSPGSMQPTTGRRSSSGSSP